MLSHHITLNSHIKSFFNTTGPKRETLSAPCDLGCRVKPYHYQLAVPTEVMSMKRS